MENRIQRYWHKIRDSILSRWGNQVSEDDLAEPMSYEDLCHFFGEKCALSRQDAEKEANRLIEEIEASSLGV